MNYGRQRSLAGYILWCCKDLNTTERLSIPSRNKDMKMGKQTLINTISRTADGYHSIVNYMFPIWVAIWKNGCAFFLGSKSVFITDILYQFTVQISRSIMSDSLRPHESQPARAPCSSPTPGLYPNSCSSSWWCHPAISSSVVPFSSCPQSLPASGSFPMNQLFTWGGQSIGVSASASGLPMNTQDWSPLGWTGWISLQSKGLSRVFSNTTDQKHQFFGAQLSSQSNSHIHTWPLEKV